MEENFPRGGSVGVKRPPPHDIDTLFNLSKPHKTKKAKKTKKAMDQSEGQDDFQTNLNLKGTLDYSKIQSGMTVLGCVRRITNLALEIELPGLCFALVPITHISEAFNKYLGERLEKNDLEHSLRDAFAIGEFLPIRIVDVASSSGAGGNGDVTTRIEASTNPAHVYAERHFNSFGKGHVVWATPTAQSDHGYEMSVGVGNVRAFLPFKNLNPGVNLAIGKPIWCVVHKFEAAPTSSLMRLSAKTDHVRTCQTDIDNLDAVIPGARVELAVEKISAHGIYGKIANKFTAYVDENYLGKPLNRVTDYQDRTTLNGYVLYVEPVTKVVYVTLRHPDTQSAGGIGKGDVVKAVVHSKATNGAFFVLPDAQKGFATNKRLLASLGAKQSRVIDNDLTAVVADKYQAGSAHSCRVLDYNHLSKTYVVSPESTMVKERTFNAHDLQPGQPVRVTTRAIKEEGIVVTCGHVTGFVPNLHVGNSLYASAVKKKFKEGQQVEARVLVVDDDKVLFTFKSQLVKNDACLASAADAAVGSKFPGVVAKSSAKGALIVFYGNVKGWLDVRGMGRHVTDPENYFFVGQVVEVYIFKVDNAQNRLTLTLLPPPPPPPASTVKLTGRYVATVRAIQDGGVDVTVDHDGGATLPGFVPDAHLCDVVSLCAAVKATLSPGTKLGNLMYVGGSKPPLYSRREGRAFSSRKVPALADLRAGDIVRCSFAKRHKNKIHVRPLLSDFSESVPVSKENCDVTMTNLVEHQLLLAKVIAVDCEKRKIAFSLKLDDVYDYTVESTLRLYSDYFGEMAHVYQTGRKLKWPICQYGPGDRVAGTVERVGEKGGCVIVASSPRGDVRAIAAPALCPATVKVGDRVTGIVIGHDFDRRYLDVCVKRSICVRFEKFDGPSRGGDADADGNVALPSASAQKLLVKDAHVVCLSTDRQLINLPRRMHVNDCQGCDSYYAKPKMKICVCGKIKSYWLGMSKAMFLRLDRSAKARKQLPEKKTKKNSEENVAKPPGKQTKNDILTAESEEEEEEIAETNSDSGISDHDDGDVAEAESDETSPPPPQTTAMTKKVVLPDVSTFFHPQEGDFGGGDDESSDDENDGATEKKKKKLSASERALALKQEEERIAKIERELAKPDWAPESAQHFDRLLLSKPDSAELWANYVAFHVAGTEIDKAKAVARRAIAAINPTLGAEKLKMWTILLNLENLYGTKASFDACFAQALTYNDSLKIYLTAVEMMAKSGKMAEMEELISRTRAKYKRELSMWSEVARICYQCGKVKEARALKGKALKAIEEKKSQMSLIVRFAIMEFQHGDADEGAAIFETILRTDSKKANLWMTYVDQLIKKGRVEEARHVLDRAVTIKLPLKSAKSIFMKFRKFEEIYGTPETVDDVKAKAQEYIDKFTR